MRSLLSFLFLACTLGAQCFAGDAADDLKKLQGTWEVVELTAYGTKVDAKEFQGTKFIFEGNKLTILPPADKGKPPAGKKPSVEKTERFVKRTFSFKLDPAKKPAHVDVIALDDKIKGTTSPGIYELKGDTLRWCQNDALKGAERPKDFAAPEKSPYYLFTLKRSK